MFTTDLYDNYDQFKKRVGSLTWKLDGSVLLAFLLRFGVTLPNGEMLQYKFTVNPGVVTYTSAPYSDVRMRTNTSYFEIPKIGFQVNKTIYKMVLNDQWQLICISYVIHKSMLTK